MKSFILVPFPMMAFSFMAAISGREAIRTLINLFEHLDNHVSLDQPFTPLISPLNVIFRNYLILKY